MTDRHTLPLAPRYLRFNRDGDKETIIYMREDWSHEEIEEAMRRKEDKQ